MVRLAVRRRPGGSSPRGRGYTNGNGFDGGDDSWDESAPLVEDEGSPKPNRNSGSPFCTFLGQSRHWGAILVLGVVLGYVVLPRATNHGFGRGMEGALVRDLDGRFSFHQFMLDLQYWASKSQLTLASQVSLETSKLPDAHRRRILVTGGAGFVGSHLVDELMQQGHEVTVLDNLFTGRKANIAHWFHHPNFRLIVHDVTEPIHLEVDEIYHLACPASPPHYRYNPVHTIKTSTMGTLNMLGLAKRVKAKILLASSSEIYGDARVHPQPEDYWGYAHTFGPRSSYDEGKRVSETMMYSYRDQSGVDVRVARIFNTFGPRMHPNDGRVVSNFIVQALQGKPLTIYGEGHQTRSFQYISDLIRGLVLLMNSDYQWPVNLGNPDEYSVRDLAERIRHVVAQGNNRGDGSKKKGGQQVRLEHKPALQDDPHQRRPDITTAKRELDWIPKVTVEEGLHVTVEYFRQVMQQEGGANFVQAAGPQASRPQG